MRIQKAFTLIELLVVVAIIVALIAILLPAMSGALQVAKDAECGAKLRQCQVAILTRAGEHFGALYDSNEHNPSPTVFYENGTNILERAFVSSYLPDLATWSCSIGDVTNIDDPRNTRNIRYGTFAYWPLRAKNTYTAKFGHADGYPLKLANGNSSTPLIQDFLSNRERFWIKGFNANHATQNYTDRISSNNPSGMIRLVNTLDDVRGGNVGAFDGSATWSTIDQMKVDYLRPGLPMQEPVYSVW